MFCEHVILLHVCLTIPRTWNFKVLVSTHEEWIWDTWSTVILGAEDNFCFWESWLEFQGELLRVELEIEV